MTFRNIKKCLIRFICKVMFTLCINLSDKIPDKLKTSYYSIDLAVCV